MNYQKRKQTTDVSLKYLRKFRTKKYAENLSTIQCNDEPTVR